MKWLRGNVILKCVFACVCVKDSAPSTIRKISINSNHSKKPKCFHSLEAEIYYRKCIHMTRIIYILLLFLFFFGILDGIFVYRSQGLQKHIATA